MKQLLLIAFLLPYFGFAQNGQTTKDFNLTETTVIMTETTYSYDTDISTGKKKLKPSIKYEYGFQNGHLVQKNILRDGGNNTIKYVWENGKLKEEVNMTAQQNKETKEITKRVEQQVYKRTQNGKVEDIEVQKIKKEKAAYDNLFLTSYKNYFNTNGDLIKYERYSNGDLMYEEQYGKDSIYKKNYALFEETTEYLNNGLKVKSVSKYKGKYSISTYEYNDKGDLVLEKDYGKRNSKNIENITSGITHYYYKYLYKDGFWVMKVQYLKQSNGKIWISAVDIRAFKIGDKIIDIKSEDEVYGFISQIESGK